MTIESLQSRREKLQLLVGQRTILFEKIGTGEVKPDSFDNRIRIGQVRGRVQTSIDRFQSQFESVDKQLHILQYADQLIAAAEKYKQDRDTRSTQLKQIEDLARKKLITDAELAQSREEYQDLLRRAREDTELREGLSLLEEKKRQEQEQKPKSKLAIESATRKVDITRPDGERRRLVYPHQGDFSVLVYLARNPNQDIPAARIREALERSGGSGSPSGSIKYLRSHLEKDPDNPEIIVMTGKGPSTAYRLRAEVEFLREKQRKSARATAKEGPGEDPLKAPVFVTRLNALKRFADQPNVTLADLVADLGPTRGDKPRNLSWNQAKMAMKRAVGKLYIRSIKEDLTPSEQETWNKVKESSGQQADQAARDIFQAKLETWFRELNS